jgi:hypothetical protein
MPQVRIHEIVGTIRVVDQESLLSPAVLERIVEAVLATARAERRDEASRRHDVRIGERDGWEDDGDRR